ncbi:MAG: protein adenylyltransferase SelO [Methylophilaceae bacterium]
MDTYQATDAGLFGFNFDNSYLRLPPVFYKKQNPVAVKAPEILLFNSALAATLGLNAEAIKLQGSQMLGGNTIGQGSEPIAQAYAGHQFGGFNMLGDGRAILLGEHITPDKQRFDVQLKGSGRTPYSRSGDGRAALGPMLREYIISEAMHALGIPTTRSLAVTTTGEAVYREHGYPGAVLTRIAASHLRVGTFQFAAAIQNQAQLQALADYTIDRHFPDIAQAENKYLELLQKVMELQASLIAKWMHVGFIHGVMNTDNMSICGETIDYGPCAFMNRYHPESVFSSIDAQGRYAFGKQPNIAHWNLVRLAEALLPLIHESEAQAITLVAECLNQFPGQFFAHWLAGMRNKLGIFNDEVEDTRLAEDLLMYMHKHNADYTNTFRALGQAVKEATGALQQTALYQDAGFRSWLALWQARLGRQAQTLDESIQLMQSANPKVIPRNHLVEAALSAVVEQGDLTLVQELLTVIANPYADLPHPARYMEAPDLEFDQSYKTFCGT